MLSKNSCKWKLSVSPVKRKVAILSGGTYTASRNLQRDSYESNSTYFHSTYAVLYQEDYTSEHMYISNLHIKIIGAFSKTQAITVEIMF